MLTWDNGNASRAADALHRVVSGGVAVPSSRRYAEACRLWNRGVQHQPAMVALCRRPEDVAAAVRTARDHGLPLSVRGGGHDWAGRALCQGGLVIDLSGMRDVAVDPGARVATIMGGARVKDAAAAAGAHGLVPALGNCGAVGIAGLTLGGGYGPFGGVHGLAADNLLAADVVLADGQCVTTGPDREPELFWALRGGGGNFGAVTSMRVCLHDPGPAMLAGTIVFPWDQAGMVLRGYTEFAASMPDELDIALVLTPGADGVLALQMHVLWAGDRRRGERAIEAVQAFGRPSTVDVRPTSYSEVLAGFDAWVDSAGGSCWATRTRWLPALTPDAVAAITTMLERRTGPGVTVNFHQAHGAMTRLAPDAAAFGLRRPHLMGEIIAWWPPEEDGATHRQWADDLWEALAPSALPGGYANLLGPDHVEDARDAYGGNAARLRAAKRRYDPDGVFASAIPLPGA